MQSQIFINVPVSDLEKSFKLYLSMGFKLNSMFSDDQAKCMIWNDQIYLMIMTHEKFKSFATKPIADLKSNLACLYSLSVENVDSVNRIVEMAKEAGAIEPKPMQDYGFMQLRTLEDFDGHTWEIFFMDTDKFQQQ